LGTLLTLASPFFQVSPLTEFFLLSEREGFGLLRFGFRLGPSIELILPVVRLRIMAYPLFSRSFFLFLPYFSLLGSFALDYEV